MTYELAKELKDAGFPQDKDGKLLVSQEHPYPENPTKDGGDWMEAHRRYNDALSLAPTLSELIEACGGGRTVLLNPRGSRRSVVAGAK